MANRAKKPEIEIDVNKVVESLTSQIGQQAQRIAVLEATINAIQSSKQEGSSNE